MLGISSACALLVLTAASVFYYQIHSIQVDDILQRHLVQQSSGPDSSTKAESQSSSEQANEKKEQTLPSVLTAPVDKANQFASKPIKTQDALDVAAILLKAGLSLKEVYYLTGQADNNLPNEQKQKIRDMLLSKLSPDEIKALRSITKPYGKGLLILDPNYPIEMVGVEDPAERKRIQKELQDKKKAEHSAPAKDQEEKPAEVATVPISTSTPASPSPTPDSRPQPASDPAVVAVYTAKLESLKTSCQGDINSLVSNVVGAKKANKDLGLKELQGMFMQKFVDAEARCDSGFNGILADATQAGVDSREIDGWKQAYHAMKQSAQNGAIAQIEKAFSNK
ncbi:hypothetical protein [Paenibacillus aestuarii]|uniref:Uncharacterized protein n=1 Tax=Paenibacillus aestuarii TaxID=516965 RepID=A0ABW0K158_9BACL|nr:hypothetical protein [Paenibacillus aestuarii]